MKNSILLIVGLVGLGLLFAFAKLTPEGSSLLQVKQLCDATFNTIRLNDTCSNPPTFQFFANADSSCTDSMIWDFGDGASLTGYQFSPSHTYPFSTQNTSYIITLTVIDTSGASCSSRDTVDVLGWETLGINISTDSGATWRTCLGTRPAADTLYKTLSIDSTAGTPAGPYTWVFDGKGGQTRITTAGRTVRFPFVYGTWSISVYLAGSSCPSFSRTLYYYTEPIPSMSPCQNTTCELDSICFINNSIALPGYNVDEYRWFFDFGNNQRFVRSNPNSLPSTIWHQYDFGNRDLCQLSPADQLGLNVDVRLVGINVCYSFGITYNQSSIRVKAIPRAEFGWDRGDTLIRCIRDSVVAFQNYSCPDSNYQDTTQYQWCFGDSLSGPNNFDTTKNPIHVFVGGIGTYNIKLVASNSCGRDTFVRVLKLVDEPFANAIPVIDQICAGDSIFYTNLSQPDSFLQFTWSTSPATRFVNGTDSSSKDPVIVFDQTGTYGVRLKAENTCPDPSYWSGIVYVDTAAVIDLSPTPDSCGPICFEPQADFFDPDPLDSIVWTFQGGSISQYTGTTPPPVCFTNYFDDGDTNIVSVTAYGFCDTVTVSDTFLLKKLPNLIVRDTTLCPGSSPFLLSNLTNVQGGSWFCTGCLLQPMNGIFNPVLGTPPSDTLKYFYQDPFPGCPLICDTSIVTYQDSPMVSISQNLTICECDMPITLTSSVPGTWSGINISPGGVFDPCLAPGIYTLCFSSDTSSAEPCTSTVCMEITVIAKPTVDVPAFDTLCLVQDTVSLSGATPSGGLWQPLNPMQTGLIAGSDQYDVGSFGIGTDTLIYTVWNMDSCSNSDTMILTIIVPDTAFAGPNGIVVCRNFGLIPLNGSPANGRWDGPGLQVPSTFDPLLLPVQNIYDLTYIIAENTTCESRDTIRITILDTLFVQQLADTQICEDSEDFFFNIGNTGGTWTGKGIVNSITGQFDPDSLQVGDSTIICYTLIDSTTQCESQSCRKVWKRPLPTVTIATQDTGYCQIDSALMLPSASPAGGIWYGPALVDSLQGLFNPILLPDTGCYEYIYKYTNAIGCSNSDTLLVCISALDSVSAGADFSICVNEAPVSLAGFPVGGTWSGGGQALINGNTFDPARGSLPADTLFYTVGSDNCIIADTLIISLLPLPIVSAPLADTVCISDAPFLIAGGLPLGGWWEGPGVMADSLSFDPALAGTTCQTLSYIYIEPNSGCSDTAFSDLCIDSLPRLSFIVPDTLCTFDTLVFINTSTYTTICWWDYGDNAGDSLFDGKHAYLSSGFFDVCLTCQNVTGCIDSVKQRIFVNETPVPSFTPSPREGCGPSLSVSLMDSSYGAGGRYYWYVCRPQGDSLLATGDETSPNAPSLVLSQGKADSVHHFKLCIVNDCDSVCFYDSVVVHPIPQVYWGPNVFDGCSPLCIQFSNLTVGLPDSFYWYIDSTQLFSRDTIPDSLCLSYNGYQDTTFVLWLIATNACGRDTFAQTIRVRPNDVDPFFTVSPQRGCAPLTLIAQDFTGYLWSAFDFGLPNTKVVRDTASYTYTQAGTYTISQYVYNGCGRDTGYIQVIVDPPSWAGFSISDSIVCPGDSICFVPDSMFFSHEWDFGDGSALSYLANPCHEFSQRGIFTIRHITRDTSLSLCPDTSYIQVRVLQKPSPYFQLNNYAGCPPLQVQVIHVEPRRRYLWDWDYNQGTIGIGQFPTHNYQQSGRYTVHLQIMDTLTGCMADSTAQIWVYDKPTSNFSPRDTTVCGLNEAIPFTYLSQGTAAPSWDLGDGTLTSLPNPTHIYGQRGVFTVILSDTNAFLCTDTAIGRVIVRPQPVAHILAIPEEGCGPLAVTLRDTSFAAGNSFVWPGSGPWLSIMDSMQIVFPAVPSRTTYTIRLAVDTLSVCFDTAETTLTVNQLPEASFIADRDSACDGDASFCFANTSTDAEGIAAYFWNFGDNTTSQQENPCHTYSQPGTYNVSMIVENIRGCRDSIQQIITVIPQPIAGWFIQPQSGCFPLDVTFANLSSSFTQAHWDFGDGDRLSSIDDTVYHTYNETGYQSFDVQLIINHSNFCFDTLTSQVEGAEVPEANFEIEVVGDPCEDQIRLRLINTSGKTLPGTGYSWDFPDDTPRSYQGFEPPVISYVTPAQRSILLVVENPLGCRDSLTQNIDFPKPRAIFDVDVRSGCENLSVTFINQSTDATSWRWDFGDGTFSQDSMPTHIYTEAGLYDVKLVIDNNGTCIDSMVKRNHIRVHERPVPDFEFTESEHTPGLVQFIDLSPVTGSFREWSLGDGTISNQSDPLHQYRTNGNFLVSLYYENQFGCDALKTDTLSINSICKLSMPNTMMPKDGPATARSFAVFHPAGVGFRDWHIAVYNRWGNTVWESTALDSVGRPAAFWDGNIGGDIAPAGVYTWKIHTGTCISGLEWKGKREGSLTLSR